MGETKPAFTNLNKGFYLFSPTNKNRYQLQYKQTFDITKKLAPVETRAARLLKIFENMRMIKSNKKSPTISCWALLCLKYSALRFE